MLNANKKASTCLYGNGKTTDKTQSVLKRVLTQAIKDTEEF